MQPRAKVSGARVLPVTNLKLAKTESAHIFMVVDRDVAAVKAFVTQARLLPLTMFGHLNS
jgi:hypothetical protein